jgi:hypothetical protein
MRLWARGCFGRKMRSVCKGGGQFVMVQKCHGIDCFIWAYTLCLCSCHLFDNSALLRLMRIPPRCGQKWGGVSGNCLYHSFSSSFPLESQNLHFDVVGQTESKRNERAQQWHFPPKINPCFGRENKFEGKKIWKSFSCLW